MERATLRLILSTAILVLFCTYIFIEIGRNPSTVFYIEGTPTGNVTSLKFTDCFDLETNTIIPWDSTIVDCPGSAWDFELAFGNTTPPHSVFFQNQLTQTRISYSSRDFEPADLSFVESLVFTNSLISTPPNRILIVHTAAGNYYKVQLVSETRNKNRATIQWEQVR